MRTLLIRTAAVLAFIALGAAVMQPTFAQQAGAAPNTQQWQTQQWNGTTWQNQMWQPQQYFTNYAPTPCPYTISPTNCPTPSPNPNYSGGQPTTNSGGNGMQGGSYGPPKR